MRVLIAPDSFTGTLTSTQAAAAMAEGWAAGAPHDAVSLLPLADGGPGFVDVLGAALEGSTEAVTVADPRGRPVPAALLVVETRGVRTAYLEAAQAAGLHLLEAVERDPALTSTVGVGQLVAAAVERGCRRVVIGLGGGGANDGGAGMLAALGAGPAEALGRGGLALAQCPDDALAGLAEVRERLGAVELLMATDDDAPLLGLQGASAVHAEEKGASAAGAQSLEAALGRLTEVAARALPPATDLLSGRPRRLDREPGAGADGGLGYGLLLLGARRVSAVGTVLRVLRLAERLRSADLVLTGEGCLDWQSLSGSVVAGVAEAAIDAVVPSVVIAGRVLVGRRETMSLGVSGCYAVAETAAELDATLLDPYPTLASRAARVARTWSPGP